MCRGQGSLQQAPGVCLFPADGRPCLHCRYCSRERGTSVTPDRSLSPVSDYRAARDRGGRPGRSTSRREHPRQVAMSHHGAIFAPAGNGTLAAAQQSNVNVLPWYSHAWHITFRLRGDRRCITPIVCKQTPLPWYCY